jgi:predicted transcriptional regulator
MLRFCSGTCFRNGTGDGNGKPFSGCEGIFSPVHFRGGAAHNRRPEACNTDVLQFGLGTLRGALPVPTTTIRLPEDLKERVARAAERAGTTSHAFILEAVAEKVDEAEHRNAFRDEAQQRYAQIIASGQTIAWSEMRRYLTERAEGKTSPRPQPGKLGR